MPHTLPLAIAERALSAEGFTYTLNSFFVWAGLPRPGASLKPGVRPNAVVTNLLVPRLTGHSANWSRAALTPGQRCRRLSGICLILIIDVWQVFHRFFLHAFHSLVGC